MPTEIYLIRHGETEWNRLGRFQGRKDSPLTPLGRIQAERIGVKLGGLLRETVSPLPILHVSPLGRTHQTAEIIAHRAGLAAPCFDDRLQELSLGSWEGLTWDEAQTGWPERIEGAGQFDWFFRSPDCETLTDAQTRVRSWLADVKGPVIAVTHGLIGRLLRGLYAGIDEATTLALPIPQDTIWHLRNGTIAAIVA